MKTAGDQSREHLRGDIRKSFEFLFERGYEVRSVREHADLSGSTVTLAKEAFILEISEERGEVNLRFGHSSKESIDIGAAIYYLSGEKNVLHALANLRQYGDSLRRHFDDIETRFRDDHVRFRREIESRRGEYESAKGRALDLRVLVIFYLLGALFFYQVFNVLVFDGLLSGLLAQFGYDHSNWIIRGISICLAFATVYIANRRIQRSDNIVKNSAESSLPRRGRNPLPVAIFSFVVLAVVFAVLIGMMLSFMPWADGYLYPIMTWGLAILLALLISLAIYRRNRR